MSPLLGPDGKPINHIDPVDGVLEIDALINDTIKQWSNWREVVTGRRKQCTDNLLKVTRHLSAIFMGAEVPNLKSSNGQLIVRLMADAALLLLIQRRIEERGDEILALDVQARRNDAARGGATDAATNSN